MNMNLEGNDESPADSAYEASLLKKVNRRLYSSEKIGKGLKQLEELLLICSDITFTSHCVKWLQVCCRLEAKERVAITSFRLKMFGKLINMSSRFPELSRPIANSVVGRFLDSFIHKISHMNLAWETLEILMSTYGGPITAHKEDIETIMRDKLLSTDKMQNCQARCFALLPSVGGGGIKGVTYKNNWRTFFDRQLNTCHSLLSSLFKDVHELQSYENFSDTLIKYPDNESFSDLSKHIENVCLIIKAMLLGKYPAPKCVPADTVVGLICRGLSVHTTTLGGKGLTRTSELQAVLPTIHKSLLQILSSLSVCCGRALAPLAGLIAKVLGQAIDAAADSALLRLQVYSTLINWMAVAGSGSCVDLIFKSLIPTILGDISVKSHSISIRDKGKSTELMRNQLDFFNEDATVTQAALQTLNSLVNCLGYRLSPGHHKMIQSVVLHMTIQLQRRSGQFPRIFETSANSRSALYAVLIQLCVEPCPQWPPPIQFALQILRCGLSDPDPSVSIVCSSGLSVLERLIHPEFCVAAFPHDYNNFLQNEADNSANLSTIETTPIVRNKSVTKSSSPWDYFAGKEANILEPDNEEVSEEKQFSQNEAVIANLIEEADDASSKARKSSLEDKINGKSPQKENIGTEDITILEKSEDNIDIISEGDYQTLTTKTAKVIVEKIPVKKRKRSASSESSSEGTPAKLTSLQTSNSLTETENGASVTDQLSSSDVSTTNHNGRSSVKTPPTASSKTSQFTTPKKGIESVYNLRPRNTDSPSSHSSGKREGSVSSQSTANSKKCPSPKSELSEFDDAIALFDETIREDFK